MTGGAVAIGPAYWAVLATLCAVAAVVAAVGRLAVARAVVTASFRAVVQLAAVSLLITWVLTAWGATAAFLALMVAVASATSARRIGKHPSTAYATVAIVAGAAPVLALIVAAGTVPLRTIAVVPVAGILIGGAMTATSLAGQRVVEVLTTRRGEFEALLSIGFTEPEAVRELCRLPAGRALHPALDQTRTVGLVTLPGAFVGVLLGGGSPIQAGATQLLVLVGLLAAEAAAILVVLELIAVDLIRRPR